MRDAHHPHPRVALRVAVRRELLQVCSVLRPQPGLLGELACRGLREILVGPHEAARECPSPLERGLATPHRQRAQRVVPHGEHDQVDGDGEGRKGRRVVGRHATILVVCLTIISRIDTCSVITSLPRIAPTSGVEPQPRCHPLGRRRPQPADPHREGRLVDRIPLSRTAPTGAHASGRRVTDPPGASGRTPASAASRCTEPAAASAAGRQAIGCGHGGRPAARCSPAYISGRRRPKAAAASSTPVISEAAASFRPAAASPATATAVSWIRTAPLRCPKGLKPGTSVDSLRRPQPPSRPGPASTCPSSVPARDGEGRRGHTDQRVVDGRRRVRQDRAGARSRRHRFPPARVLRRSERAR